MTGFNQDELSTSEEVTEHLKSIAETGNVEIEWSDLQRALILRLNAMLEAYQEKSPDNKREGEEPNVEKFDLNVSRDEIIELIESFSEPPFTIQRVCELLYSPFKYYDRISTFLRGLEKNLRVISSNNWPKSIDNSINNITCNSSGSNINISSSNNNSNNNNNSNDDDASKTVDEEVDDALDIEEGATTSEGSKEAHMSHIKSQHEENNEVAISTCSDSTKSDEIDQQSTESSEVINEFQEVS